jgi:hypothetical protein
MALQIANLQLWQPDHARRKLFVPAIIAMGVGK